VHLWRREQEGARANYNSPAPYPVKPRIDLEAEATTVLGYCDLEPLNRAVPSPWNAIIEIGLVACNTALNTAARVVQRRLYRSVLG